MLRKEFIDFGYTKEEYQMLRYSYSLIQMLDETLIIRFKEINDYLIELGYTKEDIMKMAKSLPSLYSLNTGSLKQKYDNLIALGYTKEEIIKITTQSPFLYSYSIETIRKKMDIIMSLGYTEEEALKMTVVLPPLYGLSEENLSQKIKLYDMIDIHEYAVLRPKFLMQSTALSFARYNFYLSQGIDINIDNCVKLFMGGKSFVNMSGMSKEELLSMYSYDEYLDENEVLNGTINNRKQYSAVLTKRTNFALDCAKAKGWEDIDSIETQKEIEKIMMKKIGI